MRGGAESTANGPVLTRRKGTFSPHRSKIERGHVKLEVCSEEEKCFH